jgi:exopolyphosphatase / guanosine-5'-triphosphate,3'-diphosphate pyrophosphatase
VRAYHVSFQDAEILGPALMVYVRLAQALRLRRLFVGAVSLRDGVLAEMANRGAWTDEFQQQIIHSATQIGARFQVDQPHARQVADLARTIFGVLQAEHGLGPKEELILTIAALLHDIGLYVSNRNHHKHTMYLIQNSDLFGLGGEDRMLTALVARYHRRALPKSTHEGYATLDREGRTVVSKLAAILRVADALDRGHVRRNRNVRVRIENGSLVLEVPRPGDLTLEQQGLREKGDMFEQVYGKKVVLRGAGGEEPHGAG